MNVKKFIVMLLLIIFKLSIGEEVPFFVDTVAKMAAHCNTSNDYFSNILTINKKPTIILSYFNLKEYQQKIQQALQPNEHGVYDIRNLETLYCRMAQATQPWYKTFRGSIGFCSGIAVASLLYQQLKKRE